MVFAISQSNEVHRAPCEVTDAQDVLVDALVMGTHCDALVCIDSNVSIFAALSNPKMVLAPITDVLPPDELLEPTGTALGSG